MIKLGTEHTNYGFLLWIFEFDLLRLCFFFYLHGSIIICGLVLKLNCTYYHDYIISPFNILIMCGIMCGVWCLCRRKTKALSIQKIKK